MLNRKLFLIITKFIPHLIALCYAIYTILGFCGIDAIIIGYFALLSILPMVYIFINSIVYKYCYVHRLPLYYILLNDSITVLDNYIGIPLEDFGLLVLNLIILGIVMFGYSIYYVKYKLH